MAKLKKTIVIILSVIVVLILIAAVLIPWAANVDRYRPYIVAQIEKQTGSRVSIGHLSLRILPRVAIRADQVTVDNPPNFPHGQFITAASLSIDIDLSGLWSRRINIRTVEIASPVVRLLSNPRDQWNVPTPSRSGVRPAAYQTALPGQIAFTPDVTVTNGQLSVARVGDDGRVEPATVVVQGIDCHLTAQGIAAFTASSALTGTSGRMPFRRAPYVRSIAYLVPPASPGGVDAGTIRALHFTAASLTADNLSARLRAQPERIFVDDLKFEFYSGRGDGNFALNLSGPVPHFDFQSQLAAVNIERAVSQFDKVRGNMTGSLDAAVSLWGDLGSPPDPWTGKFGKGWVKVHDGQFPKLKVNKDILELARLSQIGPAKGGISSFSMLSLNWQLADGLARLDSVLVHGNGYDMAGAGTIEVSGAQRVNCAGSVQLAAGQNPLSQILAGLSGAAWSNGKLSLPFTLTGTVNHPLFGLRNAAGQSPLGLIMQGVNSGRTAKPAPGNVLQQMMGIFKSAHRP
jgi:uncharacterized protein involved in outer membrane biogenesis